MRVASLLYEAILSNTVTTKRYADPPDLFRS